MGKEVIVLLLSALNGGQSGREHLPFDELP
jgi:hypothetical protein